MQERDLGWIAGIVDGEGTITICRISGYMRPIVQVVNTNMSLLLEVQQIFAEIIGKKTRICMITRYKKHTLDCYRIQVTKQFEVETILKTIKPYLIAKVEQARLVLDFLDLFYMDQYNKTNLHHKYLAVNLLVNLLLQKLQNLHLQKYH